jgi:DNA-binding NarL/FixJ family response regulator
VAAVTLFALGLTFWVGYTIATIQVDTFDPNEPVAAETEPEASPELTPRELEVLRLVAEGFTNQAIAERLKISRKTVDVHRTNLMRKLDLHDVTELVKYAPRRGLITPTRAAGAGEGAGRAAELLAKLAMT